MMKQLPASVRFLYEEVLQEEIDFDFNIKMKKPSRIPVALSAGLRSGELLNLKIRVDREVKDIDRILSYEIVY